MGSLQSRLDEFQKAFEAGAPPWGVGQALHERSETDPSTGRFLNRNALRERSAPNQLVRQSSQSEE